VPCGEVCSTRRHALSRPLPSVCQRRSVERLPIAPRAGPGVHPVEPVLVCHAFVLPELHDCVGSYYLIFARNSDNVLLG
jgi:hypothetical protein